MKSRSSLLLALSLSALLTSCSGLQTGSRQVLENAGSAVRSSSGKVWTPAPEAPGRSANAEGVAGGADAAIGSEPSNDEEESDY